MIDRKRIFKTLETLYNKEEKNHYLQSHSNVNVIKRQLDVFEIYSKFIPENSKVLDWGCWHSPDGVMLKEQFNNKLQIYGCDFIEENATPHFHNFSGLKYTKLEHNLKLPYEDNFFDVVNGSGVLEHVAMDMESLKEVYRVLKDDGIFIITFLPNEFSFTEFLTNLLYNNSGHKKKYKKKEALKLLLHHGFFPLVNRYHQFIPSIKGGSIISKMWFLNKLFENLFPFKYFCANIMIISKKVKWF